MPIFFLGSKIFRKAHAASKRICCVAALKYFSIISQISYEFGNVFQLQSCRFKTAVNNLRFKHHASDIYSQI